MSPNHNQSCFVCQLAAAVWHAYMCWCILYFQIIFHHNSSSSNSILNNRQLSSSFHSFAHHYTMIEGQITTRSSTAALTWKESAASCKQLFAGLAWSTSAMLVPATVGAINWLLSSSWLVASENTCPHHLL